VFARRFTGQPLPVLFQGFFVYGRQTGSNSAIWSPGNFGLPLTRPHRRAGWRLLRQAKVEDWQWFYNLASSFSWRSRAT